MHAEYKRDINHNYLILENEKEVNSASYQVRMLLGNAIPSILRCHLQKLDGKNFFHYEITSKQSVASYYEGKKIHARDLRILLEGFIHVMEDLAEYLMNPEQLLIRPDYIFMDIESESVFFCWLPEQGKEVQIQLRELLEYMLPKLAHEDQEAVLLGYGIYRRIMEPGFQLEIVKEAVYHERILPDDRKPVSPKEEISNSEEATSAVSEEFSDIFPETFQTRTERSSFGWWWIAGCLAGVLVMLGILGASMLGILPWLPVEAVMGGGIAAFATGGFAGWISEKRKKKQELTELWKKNSEGKKPPLECDGKSKEMHGKKVSLELSESENLSESPKQFCKNTEVQEEPQNIICGETVVLSEGARSGPAALVSREPGELATIYLEQELTVVGKLANASDAVVPVATVSRIHARIRKKDQEYYLADLNSRNGTMVNGQLLKNGEEYKLEDEDEVDFAQAKYIFLR